MLCTHVHFIIKLVFVLIRSWFSFSSDLRFNIACDLVQTETLVPHITHETSSMLLKVFAISHASSPDWSDTIAARCVFIPRSVPQRIVSNCESAEDSLQSQSLDVPPIPAANFVTTATWPSAGDGFYFYIMLSVPPLYNMLRATARDHLSISLVADRERWLYYFFAWERFLNGSRWLTWWAMGKSWKFVSHTTAPVHPLEAS